MPELALRDVFLWALAAGFGSIVVTLAGLITKTIYYRVIGQTRHREMPNGWFERWTKLQEDFTQALIQNAANHENVAEQLRRNGDLIAKLIEAARCRYEEREIRRIG